MMHEIMIKCLNKKFLSWDMVEDAATKALHSILKSNIKYDLILAVGRGGMVPARIVSEQLGIKSVYMLGGIHAYDDGKSEFRDVVIDGRLSLPDVSGNDILLVDDCVTTGKTLEVAEHVLKVAGASSASSIVLFKNIHNNSCIYYGEEYDADKSWLVFPWEKKLVNEEGAK